MFEKYQHLERYGNTEVEGIDLGRVYIFPKLDGTNGSVWFEDGDVKGGSRNRELSVGSDNQGFFSYIVANMNIFNFFMKNPDLRLYGEWLVPHTVKTYRGSAWNKFYIFDVTDKDGNYLVYEDYKPLLDEFNLDYLNPMVIINNPTYDDIMEQVSRNTYLIEDNKGVGEGIVLKNYSFVNKFGRVVWAKVISNEFKEDHKSTMGIPVIGKDLVEEKIIDKSLTTHLIEKTYAKIVNDSDGWTSKSIPRLLETVWYDFIKEELWDALKEHSNPNINFKTLKSLAFKKIKEVKSDLF